MTAHTIYTIGHSTLTVDNFLDILKKHSINAIADVRSNPYSRINPQFNREGLKNNLNRRKIYYVFLGRELGARSDDLSCYVSGKVSYTRLSQTEIFKSGIKRLLNGTKKLRIAIMCAEKDPLSCHRTLLVAKELTKLNLNVVNILSDASLEKFDDSMSRLLRIHGLPEGDLFHTRDQMIQRACQLQEDKIAYVTQAHADILEGG